MQGICYTFEKTFDLGGALTRVAYEKPNVLTRGNLANA